MNIFPWKKNKDFFTPEEKEQLLEAIKMAEQKTSGEVRIFVESKCRYMDALDRAKEIFFNLNMQNTSERNASLVYVAVDDHQFAVFGDEGIHARVGSKYWEEEINKMLPLFRQHKLADGICQAINDIGEALHTYFPYDRDTDKNELPDEIIFGK